jgi:ATPase subunit of ABC transporter with duplicated ATPase domains
MPWEPGTVNDFPLRKLKVYHLDLATKEMLVDALKDFEGTMIFISHDRMFLRGIGSRVLELGGESGTDRHPTVYPGSYVEYVQKLGHEAPGIYS